MSWSEFWTETHLRIKQSWQWLSVQVTAAWGAMWVIFALLPGNVIAELANIHILQLSLVGWIGLGQAVTTYMARVKPPKAAP